MEELTSFLLNNAFASALSAMLVGAVIIWLFKNKIWPDKAALYWNDEIRGIQVDGPTGSPRRRYISHTLRIENVGRGHANNIVIMFLGRVEHVLLSRYSRSSVNGISCTMSSDTSYAIGPHNSGTKLTLPSLPKKTIAEFSWVAEHLSDTGVESITHTDGEPVTNAYRLMWFMRDQDIVTYALRHRALNAVTYLTALLILIAAALEIFR